MGYITNMLWFIKLDLDANQVFLSIFVQVVVSSLAIGMQVQRAKPSNKVGNGPELTDGSFGGILDDVPHGPDNLHKQAVRDVRNIVQNPCKEP